VRLPDRSLIYLLVAVLAAGILVWLYLLRAWPLINVVETGRTPEYPDIIPHAYPAEPGRVFDAALHAVNRLPRWTLVAYRPEIGEIRAEARTRMLRFVDDVLIRIEKTQDGARVQVRSASRVGKGDFGQNARSIRAFFAELDRQLDDPATSH
jgi:uncharacterized protein (DUF1499 family)